MGREVGREAGVSSEEEWEFEGVVAWLSRFLSNNMCGDGMCVCGGEGVRVGGVLRVLRD